MKSFDIYKNGKYIETVQFKSYEEAVRVYPKHFGYSVREY